MDTLGNWRSINSVLRLLSEPEVRAMLKVELATLKRPDIVVRLHQRLTRLRAQRERARLMARLARMARKSKAR